VIVLILAGAVYALWFDSIPASILTAALVVYRAQRPSKFGTRVREAWYQRRAVGVTNDPLG
jgi:hypothetical protein